MAKIKVVDNIVYIQVVEVKRGKDRVWRQMGIMEKDIPWFHDEEMVPIIRTPRSMDMDLEKFKEGSNDF